MITLDTFKRGIKKSISTIFELAKIMIPVYIAVQILSFSGLLEVISHFFEPLMSFLGLPGEASLALVMGCAVNIYASLGIMASITLTVKQATTLAIMISIAHNLIGETAVIKKLGINAYSIVILRIVVSFVCGFIYHIVF